MKSLKLFTLVDRQALPDDEEACRRIARNLPVFVGTSFLTKTGDALLNPKITLTWIMQMLGAQSAAIALLVPLRESLSMLPQIMLAKLVNDRSRLSPLLRIGAALQAIAVFGMALVALTMDGARAGWLMLACVAGFSLARCLCSLVSKAVMAKLMPKGLRGQTGGWAASAAGLATLSIAAGLLMFSGDRLSTVVVLGLLLGAGIMWVLASLSFGLLDEPADRPGETAASTVRERLALLVDDRKFRQFVIVRTLLLSSALVAPYYLLLGGQDEQRLQHLASLLLASGIASLLSSPFWGFFSDVSSRGVLIAAGLSVAALGALAFAIAGFQPDWLNSFWLLPLCYFVLEVAHQGIRIGRKTYIVDMADDDERVDYVAASNSTIGVMLLVIGGVSSLLTVILSPAMMIAVLSTMTLVGALLARRLPEVTA